MNSTVRRRKKKKESLTPVIAALCVMIVTVIVLIAVVLSERNKMRDPNPVVSETEVPSTLEKDGTESGMPQVGTEEPGESSDKPDTDPPETNKPETGAHETESPETKAPETKAPETESPRKTYKHDYPNSLPESARVPDDWFSDALFVGDSRTVGLASYSGVESTYYGKVSLNITTAFTAKFIDDEYTILEAIAKDPKYSKVYIWFGLNDLSSTPSSFCKSYKKLIDGIRELLPDAQIYVQSVIPVSEKYAAESKYGVNNENCVKINTAVAQMCGEYESGVYFLNTAVPFADPYGALRSDVSSDGAHLNKNAVKELFEYFRTHAVL